MFQAGEGECSCGGKMVKGLCVKPNKGDAVLFWSMVCYLLWFWKDGQRILCKPTFVIFVFGLYDLANLLFF